MVANSSKLGRSFFFFLVILYALPFGQANWQPLNPKPLDTQFNGFSFSTAAGAGLAVGNSGALLRSTNNGINWTAMPSTVSNDLMAVDFVSSNVAYVVGTLGKILKSTDGGFTWSVQTSGTSQQLNAVSFWSPDSGIAVGNGNTVLRTVNGGSSWSSIAPSGSINWNGVNWKFGNTVFLVGSSGTIQVSTNAGTNWTLQTSGTTNTLQAVYALNANLAFAVGLGGKIQKYTGSSTWSSLTSNSSEDLMAVSFPVGSDSAWGMVATASGNIVHTGSLGTNWFTIAGNTSALRAIKAFTRYEGLGMGASGAVVRTTTGGSPWSTINSSVTTNNIRAAEFVNVDLGWVAGASGLILKTTNGGANWTSQNFGSNQWNGIEAWTKDTAWVVGASGSIAKTTNGGTNWTSQTSGAGTNELYAVKFPTADTGFAAGVGGTLLKTVNGGSTWSALSSGTTQIITKLAFVSRDTGWFVGVGGLIRKTVNGGTSWTTQTSGTTQVLLGVHFVNSQVGHAVGFSGTILRTEDGGSSWFPLTVQTSTNLNVVQFVDANVGYVGANSGWLLKTTDGGQSWSQEILGTSRDIVGLSIRPSSQTGYIVGTGGAIFKQTVVGRPGPPEHPKLTLSGTDLIATWAPADPGGSPLTGYLVGTDPSGASCFADPAATSCVLYNGSLSFGTTYRLYGFSANAIDLSDQSTYSNSVYYAAAPDAPSGVTATAAYHQAQLTWSAPSNNGSPITNYTVTASPGGMTYNTGNAFTNMNITATPTGNSGTLVIGTTYTFTIKATNAYGTGSASSATASITPFATPSAPTGTSAVPGNTEALVSWTPSSQDSSSAITGYTATSSPGGLTCSTGPSTNFCTVPGLTNGTSYSFTVKAANAAGNSPASVASPPITPNTYPNPPTGLTALPGNTQALASWTPPASGASPTGFTVTAFPGGANCSSTVPTTSCTLIGLTNGTAYIFVAAALNAAGMGTLSVPTVPVTPFTVPGAPTALTAAVGQPGSGQVSLAWNAPQDNGGAALTGYKVVAMEDTSKSCLVSDATLLNCLITDLTAGTSYTFTAFAINAAGMGEASEASAPVSPPTALRPSAFLLRVRGDERPYAFTLPAGSIAATERLSMTISDAAGREIWSKSVNPAKDKSSQVLWDGKTRTGVQAPAGMYIVRISIASEGKETRLLRSTVSLKPR